MSERLENNTKEKYEVRRKEIEATKTPCVSDSEARIIQWRLSGIISRTFFATPLEIVIASKTIMCFRLKNRMPYSAGIHSHLFPWGLVYWPQDRAFVQSRSRTRLGLVEYRNS